MKSFGIWCQNQQGENSPSAEIHINLWNIKDKNIKESFPFIDLGLLIKDFRIVQQIQILIPFEINECEIQDLFDKVKDSDIARTIFNDNNCETASKNLYSYINKHDGTKNLLLFPLKSNNKFEDAVSLDIFNEGNEKFSILKIDFKDLKKDSTFDEFEDIYMRFRLTSHKLKEMLFSKLSKKNWFLESGFVTTQIIDVKINKERNLPQKFTHRLTAVDGYVFFRFDKIHFLIMNSANDDVEILSKNFSECRKLETTGWNEYLDNKYITKDVLVYHFKRKTTDSASDKKIKEFSELAKVSSHTTNVKVISVYIGIVLVLNMIAGIIVNNL